MAAVSHTINLMIDLDFPLKNFDWKMQPAASKLCPYNNVLFDRGIPQIQHGFHSGVLDGLTPTLRKRVDVLRQIQNEHDQIKAAYFKDRAALLFKLESKYQKLYEPLYSQRCEIVNGDVEFDGAQAEAASDETDDKDEKGVPNFWLTAMKTHEIFDHVILEQDEDALKYLKNIKLCLINDDPESFKLEFCFEFNPYFTNSVLTKEYHMIYVDEPIITRPIGTNIKWKPGKCLTQKIFEKKTKSGLDTKTITKIEKCESFFNFFSPPEVPKEDIDEVQSEELQNQLLQDYDIGSTIRYKIIPHAVSWFTGEADSEDIEELEDDEEESRSKTKAKNGSITPAGATAEGERPPECNQQYL